MSFTRHGHHISGTTLGTERPDSVARCGGERICGKCQRDAAKARQYPATYEVKFDENGGLISAAKKATYTMVDYNDRVYRARELVFEYVKSDPKVKENHPTFAIDEVTIVWFCKILQHWKTIVITTLPDAKLYEVTFNGDKDEFYLDAYEKTDNVKYQDRDER